MVDDVNQLNISIYTYYLEYMSLRFSINAEADISELLENLKELFLVTVGSVWIINK